MKIKFNLLFFATFALLFGTLNSANALSQDITSTQNEDFLSLGEILDLAKNAPFIQNKQYQAKAAQNAADAQKSEYLPQVNIGYNFQHTINPNILYPKLAYGAFIEAKWLAFDGGGREARAKSKEHEANAANFSSKNNEQDIYLQSIRAYFAALSADSKISALQNAQKELQENIKKSQNLYDNGLLALDSLEAIKAKAAQIEYDLYSAQSLKSSYLTHLSTLCDKEISLKNLNPQEKLKSIAEIYESSPEQSAEVKAANELLKAEQARVWEYNYLPSVALSNLSTFYRYKDRNMPDFGNLPINLNIDEPKYQNIFSLQISFPLFDGFYRYNAKNAQKAAALGASADLGALKANQNAQFQIAKAELSSAFARLESAAKAQQSAQLAHKNMSVKFSSQLADYTQYLSSLSTALNAQAAFLEANFALEIAKAELIKASGRNLRDFVE